MSHTSAASHRMEPTSRSRGIAWSVSASQINHLCDGVYQPLSALLWRDADLEWPGKATPGPG